MRPSQRQPNELRKISFSRHYTDYAEGSVLACCGNTKVLCNVSIEPGVPRFLKGSCQGWLTAEYGMLPRSTHTRNKREASRGKQSGRTVEIQRLIGRCLRNCIDLKALGDFTINIDCDVIQADGGTRTTAINGSMVALMDAVDYLLKEKKIASNPITHKIAALSVGIYEGTPVLDLDYAEDSTADTDMNVVVTESGDFVEIQGTAEGAPLSASDLQNLLALAAEGAKTIFSLQAT